MDAPFIVFDLALIYRAKARLLPSTPCPRGKLLLPDGSRRPDMQAPQLYFARGLPIIAHSSGALATMTRSATMIRLFIAALTAFCLPLQAGALQQLQRFVQSRSASADFSQSTLVRNKVQHSSGHLAISRPDRFRWEYRQPEPQFIIGDGQQLWIYDVDLNQVTVKNQKATLGDSPAALLAGNGDVSRWYALSEQGSKDGLDWLQARPLSRETGYANVRLAFAADELKVMELTDFTGQTTRIEFSAWKKNANLPDSLFNFKPPKGADVLSD